MLWYCDVVFLYSCILVFLWRCDVALLRCCALLIFSRLLIWFFFFLFLFFLFSFFSFISYPVGVCPWRHRRVSCCPGAVRRATKDIREAFRDRYRGWVSWFSTCYICICSLLLVGTCCERIIDKSRKRYNRHATQAHFILQKTAEKIKSIFLTSLHTLSTLSPHSLHALFTLCSHSLHTHTLFTLTFSTHSHHTLSLFCTHFLHILSSFSPHSLHTLLTM